MGKLGRDIILLGWISFFTDMSSEAIMPVLPFFISTLHGISSIGSGFALGLIMGFGTAMASIVNFFSGMASDQNFSFHYLKHGGIFLPLWASKEQGKGCGAHLATPSLARDIKMREAEHLDSIVPWTQPEP